MEDENHTVKKTKSLKKSPSLKKSNKNKSKKGVSEFKTVKIRDFYQNDLECVDSQD